MGNVQHSMAGKNNGVSGCSLRKDDGRVMHLFFLLNPRAQQILSSCRPAGLGQECDVGRVLSVLTYISATAREQEPGRISRCESLKKDEEPARRLLPTGQPSGMVDECLFRLAPLRSPLVLRPWPSWPMLFEPS